MNVKEYAAAQAVAIAADNDYGYSNDYPNNRFSTDSTPKDGDCGAFGTEAFRRALLKIGINIGTAYYEPTGGYYPWDGYGFLEKYFDRLPYEDYRNEVGDLLVSNGHTVVVTSVKETNGKGYDEITHARNDDDGKPGDHTTGREITTQAIYDGGFNWIFRLKDEYNKEIGEDPTPTSKFAYGEITELWACEKGDQGGHVITLQAVLHSKYNCYDGDIDGDFGSMTEGSVKKFQEMADLYVDGLCGPKTWYTLLCSNVVRG